MRTTTPLWAVLSPLLVLPALTAAAADAAAPAATPARAKETAAAPPKAGPGAIKLVVSEAERRVDVTVDGQPFTSYLWSAPLSKPVLFPVRTASGKVITRGFPLEPHEGESTDHPHHVGLWFNYGDVAGADFWGNAGGVRKGEPASPDKPRIVHKAIGEARGGAGKGELSVSAEWVLADGKTLLREATRFGFAAGPGRRAIDRIATLTAVDAPVPFPDNKEGMMALRLGRALEQPSAKNAQATGRYRSSEGKEGDAVWGTRGRWVMLTGTLEGEAVTVAMLDHPKNPGAPTYWHARGYGLFAANPLGQKAFTKGQQTLDFTLRKGQPARFAYRVVVLSHEAKADEIEAEYQRFVRELK